VVKALSSVNLAVVLIAFLGIECTSHALTSEERYRGLQPDEQLRQFNYARVRSSITSRRGRRGPEKLDERSEAYYKILSDKFGQDYAKRQRRDAVAALKREGEDRDIEKYISSHKELLNDIFVFMQGSGLFHAHSAWWFRSHSSCSV